MSVTIQVHEMRAQDAHPMTMGYIDHTTDSLCQVISIKKIRKYFVIHTPKLEDIENPNEKLIIKLICMIMSECI